MFNPFIFIRGLSSPSSGVQTVLTRYCLNIPGFPYNLLPVCCGNTGFKKKLGLVLACKSGLRVPLLPVRPSCPLQTILLRDLVGCDRPLQIVNEVWHTFFQFEVHQTAIIVSSCMAVTPCPGSSNLKKSPLNCNYYLQKAVIPDWIGSICPLRTYHSFFSRAEKPSENINTHLFLMNKKGLRNLSINSPD